MKIWRIKTESDGEEYFYTTKKKCDAALVWLAENFHDPEVTAKTIHELGYVYIEQIEVE